MQKASSEEFEKVLSEGLVFRKGSAAPAKGDKVRTKAKKKAYRTGSHGSAAAIKKEGIRKHRAEKSKRR